MSTMYKKFFVWMPVLPKDAHDYANSYSKEYNVERFVDEDGDTIYLVKEGDDEIIVATVEGGRGSIYV